MHPYRTQPKRDPPDPPPPPTPDDDPIILGLALCVSVIGLVPQLAHGGPWGAEPTLALLIAVTSAVLLIRRKTR